MLAVGTALVLGAALGLTTAHETARAIKEPMSMTEYAKLRRNYMFGHREMSDLADGMAVVATSVDIFANRDLRSAADIRGTKLHKRFLDSLDTVKFLSRFSLGMDEIYFFPAMYLLFEEGNADAALATIDLGVADRRTQARVPLLAAYTAHVFMRNPRKAGEYYLEIPRRFPDAPPWVAELGQKLVSGQDPIDTNPQIRKQLLDTVKRAFPEAEKYIEKYQNRNPEGGAP